MKLLLLVLLGPTVMLGLLAQTTEPSSISIGALLVQLGLSGVFLWQWLRADKRAQEQSDKLLALAERMLPVLESATDTLDRVQQGMERQVDRATPSSLERADVREFSQAVYRLEQTLRYTRRSSEEVDDGRRDRNQE